MQTESRTCQARLANYAEVQLTLSKITINPPNRPIWFVDDPLWFADAAFCISKHPTSVKNNLHFRTFLPKSLHNPNKCLTFAPSVLAKPLNNAQIVRGVFCFYRYMATKIPFIKTYSTPQELWSKKQKPVLVF